MQAFATGGVVDSPTLFPMANGTGLMGEAGAEAIMPLKRQSNGDLGVQAEGMSPTINVYNNSDASIEVQQRPNNEFEIFVNKVNSIIAGEQGQNALSAGVTNLQTAGIGAS